MLKQILLTFFVITSLLTLTSAKLQARELDMNAIQKTIKENTPITTESNAVNLIIVYSELMSYLSADLANSMANDIKAQLPEIKRLVNQARDSRNREVLDLIEQLKNRFVVLVEGINKSNTGVKNLSQQIVALNNTKEKFPNGKFVPTLDLLISLTQEFSVDFENFTIELNRYVTQMTDVQQRIEKNSSKTAKSIEQLAETELSIEKHSFEEIGNRFQDIGSVLKMMYEK